MVQDIEKIQSLLLEQGAILAIDWQAALLLTNSIGSVEKGAVLAAAFLFAASRLGNLCVALHPEIQPNVRSLWLLDNETLQVKCESLIEEGLETLVSYAAQSELYQVRNKALYLTRNASLESEVIEHFQKLESQIPEEGPKVAVESKNYTDEQKNAISKSLISNLSFIVGGPGVGKTYTCQGLVKTFLQTYPESLVAVVAPTGKAVANLQQRLSSQPESHLLIYATLHKLFQQNIHSYLPYDLILVDESSMIDVTFFAKLFRYLKPNAKLILVGDPNQLPPVGVGTIFSDLISKSQSVARLTRCMRTDIQTILNSAQLVNEGDSKKFVQDFFTSTCHALPPIRQLADQLACAFSTIQNSSDYKEQLFNFKKHQILTALKRGEYGSDNLNELIRLRLKNLKNIPIIITKNDYHLELFNGDQGMIDSHSQAVFIPRHDQQSFLCTKNRVRKIPLSLISSFELGFCLSIHKSQGSEYQKVSIVLPPQSESFGRQLLYTAITRAKKEFEIFCHQATLFKIINNSSERVSGLNCLT